MKWVKIAEGGPVPYDYEIMQDPVTNAEYAEWLNSLSPDEAAKHYCKLMADHFFGGIVRNDKPSDLQLSTEVISKPPFWCGETLHLRGGGVLASPYERGFEIASTTTNSPYVSKPGFEKKPVVFVSWHDAQAYGASMGGRLPTVEEWKKAAAWLPSENRFALWCTGLDEPPSQTDVNFYDFENGWALPCPHLADVDWYRPSGSYGLRGMAGNVGEWSVRKRTEWQPALGGSLFRPVEFCRVDASEADHPSKRLSTFGFRLVRLGQ